MQQQNQNKITLARENADIYAKIISKCDSIYITG